MKSQNPAITVFTPTFNRAKTLPRVYNSLINQTIRNFEWLIVDDGSKDDTSQLVNKWIQESDFSIRYYWQKNQGKHTAFNFAVGKALGMLFAPLDSDDEIIPDALERLLQHWTDIPKGSRSQFAGICVLCKNQHGQQIGKIFPQTIFDASSLDLRYRYKLNQETWGCIRTDVLREFPFPSMQTTLLPEGVVWSEIALHYKTRFVNDILRIYWVDEKHTNALSEPTQPGQHAHGLAYWHLHTINRHMRYFRYDPLSFLKSAANYARFSLHAKQPIIEQFKALSSFGRLLWALMFFVGLSLYMLDHVHWQKKMAGH